MKLTEKAFQFATEAHRGQRRKSSNIPYMTHPVEVMKRVSDYGIKKDSVLAAALLHDVKEDCIESYSNNILTEFGWEVNSLVNECTRPQGDHATKLEKYQFLQSFKNKSIFSLIIKIADRYCNVKDYERTPGKLEYSSKYALQAYPLYHTFWKRHPLSITESLTNLSCIRILGDLIELNIIANDCYKGFSFMTCNLDTWVKERVVDNLKTGMKGIDR